MLRTYVPVSTDHKANNKHTVVQVSASGHAPLTAYGRSTRRSTAATGALWNGLPTMLGRPPTMFTVTCFTLFASGPSETPLGGDEHLIHKLQNAYTLVVFGLARTRYKHLRSLDVLRAVEGLGGTHPRPMPEFHSRKATKMLEHVQLGCLTENQNRRVQMRSGESYPPLPAQVHVRKSRL